ncbi:hypothetical protein VIBNIAM115_1480031 [Vibrio nigripulchritudo AM115]|nr:hypothetical protein VIBNIAM115_1480031 [Vibrio nigripulchritudo AM115]
MHSESYSPNQGKIIVSYNARIIPKRIGFVKNDLRYCYKK